MKTVKYIIIILALIFGAVLTLGFVLTIIKISNYSIDLTDEGFSFFISNFRSLKEPLTLTIALLSTYFILFQIENINKSNKRTNEILENDVKNRTLEQSKFFYSDLQPVIRKTYLKLGKENNFMLNQTWIFEDFSWQSVNEQHKEWQPKYDKLSPQLKDKITEILNMFESLSAIILNGNIERKLAFRLFGKPYIKQIEVLYPFIAQARDRKKKIDENYYNSIFDLYEKWKKNKNGL